jgi:FMN phosphatase YigB (HAD superfamily)
MFAAFDIDGTLIRWQLYHAIVDELAKLGYLSGKDFEAIRVARRDWKTRAPQASFKSYENELVNVYRANLAAIEPARIDEATEKVFDEYKDQVYI